MGRDSHYIIAPFETLVDPSLDPAFSGLPPEGTGPAPKGLLLPPQRQFAIGLGFGLIASNAPVIADDGPVAQLVQDLNFNDVPTIADDGPIAQPVQDFFGVGFQHAPSNSPARARVRCSECCAIFNKDNWRRHVNEVHGAKPKTSCDRCGKSFKRKSSHKCKSS
ncbi:hypothetical protein BDR03DRAFT_1007143 [Suillus americanus]|nr:hypothetical protein BDR03DRAFT_1007143 [Suillus americanus]